MALKNLSARPSPTQVTEAITPAPLSNFNITIAMSGLATCKPKHCGGPGECRRTIYVEAGSESVPNDGPGHPGLDPYKANGNYIIVEEPDDSGDSSVSYYGQAFNSAQEMYDTCDEDGANPRVIIGTTIGGQYFEATGCYDPLISFSTAGGDLVYIPTAATNQTDCLSYAASLPSGEVANWYTNINPSLPYLSQGPGAGYLNEVEPK